MQKMALVILSIVLAGILPMELRAASDDSQKSQSTPPSVEDKYTPELMIDTSDPEMMKVFCKALSEFFQNMAPSEKTEFLRMNPNFEEDLKQHCSMK